MRNLKSFLQFSLLFGNNPLTIEGITYSIEELYKINGFVIPIHENFDNSKDIVTYGRFIWDHINKVLYMFMWLKPEEINLFKREIMTGQLIPSKIHIVTDTVDDIQIKKYFQSDSF